MLESESLLDAAAVGVYGNVEFVCTTKKVTVRCKVTLREPGTGRILLIVMGENIVGIGSQQYGKCLAELLFFPLRTILLDRREESVEAPTT